MKLTEEPDLTRAEIIQILHDCLAISRKDAKHILERFLDIMAKGLGNGERVVLSGLGSFQVKPTPARPGRNPKTGKQANVPAKNRLSFAMSPSLRASMAEFIIQSRAAALPQYVPGNPARGEPARPTPLRRKRVQKLTLTRGPRTRTGQGPRTRARRRTTKREAKL